VKKLTSDDISAGILITAGEARYDRVIGYGPFVGGTPTVISQADRSYMGDVYEVKAVDFPYMVIALVVSRTGAPPRDDFDKRPKSVTVTERPWYQVSPEFVAALQGITPKGTHAP
jgi:hypothetical protein